MRALLVVLLVGCGAPSSPASSVRTANQADSTDERTMETRLEALAAASDPGVAASALLRLAVLAHDAGDDARARTLFERMIREHPDHRETSGARLQLAYAAHDAGDDARELAHLLALLCPSLGVDPLASAPPSTVPALTSCEPRAGRAATVAHAWFLLGEHEFESTDEGALDRAALAYAHAASEPTLRSVAIYKRAWSLYRSDHCAEAMDDFARLLDDPRPELARDARDYLAVCIVEPDWDADGADDPVRGLARPEVRALLDRSPHASQILSAVVEALLADARCDDARAALDELAAGDAGAARALEPRLEICPPLRRSRPRSR